MSEKEFTEYSNYLSRIQQKYSDSLDTLPDNDNDALLQLLSVTRSLSINNNDTNLFSKELRKQKSLFAYRWAHARLNKTLSHSELSQLQTDFAITTIEKSLKAAWSDKPINKLLPKDLQQTEDPIPGLFILGLGKLGGGDLNFSSDIDLISFYDPDQLPIASVHGRADVCSRVLNRLTQILNNNIEGEFVWRVDWRLRPNASSRLLAMSVNAAEDFYFFHSQPWHRLAMLKANVIAGDLNLGQSFLENLTPYLWRVNLDFHMVDEVYYLKSKINQEHPQLKTVRNAGELDNIDNCNGFNTKLGKGGIREIEFIANSLQLLWGGKKPELQTKNTLVTLDKLSEINIIPQENADKLKKAYTFLRFLEDSIQMLDNLQQHSLPQDEQTLEKLLGLMGYSDSNNSIELFWSQLKESRHAVSKQFLEIFEHHKPKNRMDDSISFNYSWIESLSKDSQAIFESWCKGFTNYGVQPQNAEALVPLAAKLAELLDNEKIDIDSSIKKLHLFFKSIPKGNQYLHLLLHQTDILHNIVKPLFYSPAMSSLLEQSPHIVDYLIEPKIDLDEKDIQLNRQYDFDSDFIFKTNDYEKRLERIRRFVNEQLYNTYLQLMHGSFGANELQQILTQLAKHTICLGLKITNNSLNLEESPIAIIGMGKLGMDAMAPMSDLDLIFVTDSDKNLEFACEYASRFQHLMELRTREGRAYEMDMRLRPSGSAGPVTISFNSFKNYQNNNAKTWEHIALTAGRAIAGPENLVEKINTVRSEILARPREKKQLMLDAAKMLARIQKQKIEKDKSPGLDVKLCKGGLMELDYLSACQCLLTEPETSVSMLQYQKMMEALFSGEDFRHITLLNEKQQNEYTLFWRKLQIWSRIFGMQYIPLKDLNPEITSVMLNDMECNSISELEDNIQTVQSEVTKAVDTMKHYFEKDKPGNWDDWIETNVQWLN